MRGTKPPLLRATGQSKIEKTLQVPEAKELVASLADITERAGFDLPSFCRIIHRLCLQLNSSDDKELGSLVDVLYTYGFLPSRDPF